MSFTQRLEALLPEIRKLGTRTAELYSDAGQLQHFQRLAETLLERFSDEPLAFAGFLHGIASDQWGALKSRVPGESLEILEDWDRLVSLYPTGKGPDTRLSDRFDREIFDQVEARSALLLVYERLDRFDPEGHLAQWNRRFRGSPELFEPLEEGKEFTAKDFGAIERYSRVNPRVFVEEVVAPAARAWGLWQEHTVLRDVALAYRDPTLFRELAGLAKERHVPWGCLRAEKVQKSLEQKLRSEGVSVEARWEWRHLASIAEQLSQAAPDERLKRLGRCGFVTLFCGDERACYQVLGAIHSIFDFKQEFFRDALGRPTRSGYRALHTAISDPLTEGENKGLLSIRLTPRADAASRLAPSGSAQLEALRAKRTQWRLEEIQVYHEGEPRYVPAGTTVLDLVALIQPELVPIVKGAKIRGTSVGRFHVLRSGDVVELERAKHQALPDQWEKLVEPSSAKRIKEALRAGFDQLLEASARAGLREALGKVSIEAEFLDVFFEAAVARTKGKEALDQHGTFWWLRQVGLVNRVLRNEPVPHPPELEEGMARRLVKATVHALKQMRSLVPVFDVDPTSIEEIIRCPKCRPNQRSALAVAASGGRLTIHREGEACAVGASPLRWKSITAGQVFHVELSSQPGMMRETLGVFTEREINLLELVLRPLGPEWGVARLQIEPVERATIQVLKADLAHLEGVSRVFGPEDDVPEVLLQGLPPRVDDGPWLLTQQPEPFVCGPVVREPHHFYGRRAELRELFQLVEGSRGSQSQGELVFVSGPLKSGKTSLVQRVQAILTQNRNKLTLCAYHKAAIGESWSDVEGPLFQKLLVRLEESGYAWFSRFLKLGGDNLRELLKSLRGARELKPAVMLVVDEAVRLMAQTEGDEKSMARLRSFCALVSHTPGVLLVWVGPSAPVHRLDPGLRELLVGRSVEIRVQPLDVKETRDMLKAQKLSLFHKIDVGSSIAQRVHSLAGGDPFWIAHMGYRMWRAATVSEGSGKRIRFSEALVEQASRELVQFSAPFRGRLFPAGLEDETERQMLALLFGLAELEGSGEGKGTGPTGFGTAEILLCLERRKIMVPRETAHRFLYEMMARGGTVALETGKWRIAAPLVKRFVEHQRATLGWEGLGLGEVKA